MLQDARYFKKGLEAEAYDCVEPLKGFSNQLVESWHKTGALCHQYYYL